ncbi:MAG: anti-sigma factor [Rhodospirillales bacterium]|nr:anti-sigma factor [Rhodospirillales bacterium]
MSDTPERDLLAGEYVLGTLDEAERAAAAALAAQDADFARAVAVWERRLAPLADLAAPAAPPPEVWERIAASLDALPAAVPARQARGLPASAAAAESAGGPAVGRDSGLSPAMTRPFRFGVRFWQATTFGALALAAALAGFIVLRPPMTPGLAVLMPKGGGPAAMLAVTAGAGEMMIRPASVLAPVPPGREMELWALPPGARQPRALGMLPPGGRRLRMPMRPGTEIMVSLEPAGGSPTGLPTGPVVYAGRLQEL